MSEQNGRENWRFDTLAVHGGYSPNPLPRRWPCRSIKRRRTLFDSAQHGADLFDLKVPGNIYTRIMNPTQDVLEQRLAALEGGIAALALASGQAAVTYSILTIAEAGDNIVASNALYGGSYNLFAHTLPQFGITTRFADYRNRIPTHHSSMPKPRRFSWSHSGIHRVMSPTSRLSPNSRIGMACH